MEAKRNGKRQGSKREGRKVGKPVCAGQITQRASSVPADFTAQMVNPDQDFKQRERERLEIRFGI